ncbi:helix-turn-helix-type transcriptional regulator [Sphingobacteriaceae bacterium]|nr:helix-turn-helix-type transcriptional regulator [Sphingobacteriaceae bacterium]
MSGIKAHTLRIWELRYNILKPERTTTNIRYYNNDDLRRILNISILNKNGHKISNIADLDDVTLVKEVEKYLNDYLKESNKIEGLYMSLLDMNEDRFEEIINNSILNLGFENTIEKIVFPFLKHLGNMWQIGAISPAQEHYISNLVRQKLIAGLDRLSPEIQKSPKTFLFFLPNNELHEMGLLYTCYLAKAKGHKCLYLGQSVPLDDLIAIGESVGPDYLVSILTSRMPDNGLEVFLNGCEQGLRKCKFLLSGRLIMDPDEKVKLPSQRFLQFEDFNAFKKQL